jgi:hypothetical protein
LFCSARFSLGAEISAYSHATITRQMHAGTVIDYRLRVRGFSVQWRSGITEWEPRHRFVEEQIRGRYRLWSICTGFNRETEARLRTAMCGTLFRSIGSSTKLLCGQT